MKPAIMFGLPRVAVDDARGAGEKTVKDTPGRGCGDISSAWRVRIIHDLGGFKQTLHDHGR